MSRQQANVLYNLFTLLFLALTGTVVVLTAAIAGGVMDPPLFQPGADSPPPTVAALASPTPALPDAAAQRQTPTPTVWPSLAPPTVTDTPAATASMGPTMTPSLAPTATRTPLPTRGSFGPTFTPTATLTWTPSPTAPPAPLGPTATPTPVLPFIMQPGTPMLRTNFANADGCNWQGIAGLVVDDQGDQVLGVRIVVSGETLGDQSVISGTHTFYGPSGWEVVVGSTPNNDNFTVTLVGDDGAVLSPTAEIVFPSACEQNLALVNFVQIRPY